MRRYSGKKSINKSGNPDLKRDGIAFCFYRQAGQIQIFEEYALQTDRL
jgi:hypothetical protein